MQKVGGGIAHRTVPQALGFTGNQLLQLQHWHSRTQQSWGWWSCDHKTVSCLILSQSRKTNWVQQKTLQSPMHIYVTSAYPFLVLCVLPLVCIGAGSGCQYAKFFSPCVKW